MIFMMQVYKHNIQRQHLGCQHQSNKNKNKNDNKQHSQTPRADLCNVLSQFNFNADFLQSIIDKDKQRLVIWLPENKEFCTFFFILCVCWQSQGYVCVCVCGWVCFGLFAFH